MLKKLFSTKRKQDPGRHNLNKITMDAASVAILSRHFSPLSCRAKSPSDLLDIVGYPTTTVLFSPILYSTPLALDDSQAQEVIEEVEVKEEDRELRLTIRNNTTPNHDRLLLETSREDKTLVEVVEEEDLTTQEVIRLHQKLIEFEKERERWQEKLQGYIEREEQMRKIIKENRQQLNQLQIKINNNNNTNSVKRPSRNNSYKTVSTLSSMPSIEFDDIDNNNHNYYYYPTLKQRQPIYYYYYPPPPQQQQHYYYYYDSF